VYHIEYAPEQPEPYYKATGKELQPRPVGEEHGIIVYNYMPISAVHYVSRLFIIQMLFCLMSEDFEVQCQGRRERAKKDFFNPPLTIFSHSHASPNMKIIIVSRSKEIFSLVRSLIIVTQKKSLKFH
jgi:hypothetical protein